MDLALNNLQRLICHKTQTNLHQPNLPFYCIYFPFGHHYQTYLGGARSVMVIIAGNGHGDTSPNPGRD